MSQRASKTLQPLPGWDASFTPENMSRKRPSSKSNTNLGKSFASGMGIGLVLFAISLALVLFWALSAAKSYVRSDKFREMVAGKISKKLNAAGQIEPVSWQDSSAFTDRVTARGYEDAAFAKLEVSGVRIQVDLSARNFRRGVWKIPEISASQLDIVLSESRLPGSFREQQEEESPAPISADEGGLAALLPREIEVDKTRITNLNFYWERNDQKLQATGIETTLTPTSSRDSMRVQCLGGELQSTELDKMKISEIDLNWNFTSNDFYISKATIELADDAILTVEGDIKLGDEQTEGEMLLLSEITNLDLQNLVAESWQRRLKGEVTIDAQMKGNPQDFDAAVLEGSVKLDGGIIEALPVLDLLGAYTQNDRFRKIALRDGGTAQFRRQGQQTQIRNIDFQSDGLARLIGALTIQGEQLSGTLQLGVVPGTLKLIPGAERNVFVESRDGYLWTDITVSGTTSAPQHDLVAQLRDAGVDTALDFGRNVISDPMKAKDDALQMGTDFLKGFFK